MWNLKTNSKWKRILLLLAFLICLGSILTRYYWSEKENQDEYTFYFQAINLATTDASKAFDLCSKTDKMRNECLTEITKIISTKDVKRGISICENITEIGWRDECLFNIASSSVHNTSLVIEICEMSKLFKHDCYTRSAFITASSLKNISSAILFCNEVPIESRSSCFFGLGSFFGDHFSENVSSAVSACNDISIEFKDDCFVGLANSFRRFGNNVSSIISACNNFPIEFRIYCPRDAGSSFSQIFGYDINSAISACNEFPFEFRPFCLLSLSYDKGRIGGASLCNKFEHPYDITCFSSFGKTEGITFSKEKTVQCSNIIDENLKAWCYRGFGRGLGELFSDNVSLAVSICNSSSSGGYNFDCYNGIVDSIACLFLEPDSFSVLDKCGRAGNFSSYCFERVGKKSVEVYNYNLSKSFNMCYEVNEHFRDSCFTGIGKGLGEYFLYNFSLASMKCNKLSNPYNIDCKKGLEEIIKFYNVSS